MTRTAARIRKRLGRLIRQVKTRDNKTIGLLALIIILGEVHKPFNGLPEVDWFFAIDYALSVDWIVKDVSGKLQLVCAVYLLTLYIKHPQIKSLSKMLLCFLFFDVAAYFYNYSNKWEYDIAYMVLSFLLWRLFR